MKVHLFILDENQYIYFFCFNVKLMYPGMIFSYSKSSFIKLFKKTKVFFFYFSRKELLIFFIEWMIITAKNPSEFNT